MLNTAYYLYIENNGALTAINGFPVSFCLLGLCCWVASCLIAMMIGCQVLYMAIACTGHTQYSGSLNAKFAECYNIRYMFISIQNTAAFSRELTCQLRSGTRSQCTRFHRIARWKDILDIMWYTGAKLRIICLHPKQWSSHGYQRIPGEFLSTWTVLLNGVIFDSNDDWVSSALHGNSMHWAYAIFRELERKVCRVLASKPLGHRPKSWPVN